MATSNGGDRSALWKLLFSVSLTANLTGTAAFFSFGMHTVSVDDLEKAILKAPYPWMSDRGQVMSHVTNADIHENDTSKRARIRGEIEQSLAPLKQELTYIREDHRDLRALIQTLADKIDNMP